MRMPIVVVCFCLIGACEDAGVNRVSRATATEQDLIDRYNREYERQMTLAADQFQRTEGHLRRYDALLTKWEEQTQRQEEQLVRWEKILNRLERLRLPSEPEQQTR